VAVGLTSHVPMCQCLGARVQQLSCLVPYSVGVMESKSAVTSGLKQSALLKKIQTVMWMTTVITVLVMTNMAQVLYLQ